MKPAGVVTFKWHRCCYTCKYLINDIETTSYVCERSPETIAWGGEEYDYFFTMCGGYKRSVNYTHEVIPKERGMG